jgi:hypothetical protein
MTDELHAKAEADERLCITVPAGRISCFFPLLQKGFALAVPLGRPIRSLLRGEFGLPDEYIETRIQTVFLDGKPVDDLDTAMVREGSTLALAPAMPGLMGAMLRRGGHLAVMRSGITHRDDAVNQGIGNGRIIVKLFGMALQELGPQLLAHGIGVDAGDLSKVVSGLPEDCREGLGNMEVLKRQGSVVLRVTMAQTSPLSSLDLCP